MGHGSSRASQVLPSCWSHLRRHGSMGRAACTWPSDVLASQAAGCFGRVGALPVGLRRWL